MQWSHKLSDSERRSFDFVYSYSPGRPIESETTYEIIINIEGSTKAVFGRYLGCIMIGFMPDEGLEEALFSLRDMLEFYSNKPKPRPARLTRAPIDATIVNRRKRPDLVLTE